MTVTLETRITVGKGVLTTAIAGEAVLLSLETGRYYGLDEVGTRMWTLLTELGEVEPAYRALLGEYDVAEERLLQDLLRLVDELVAHRLVLVDGVGGHAA